MPSSHSVPKHTWLHWGRLKEVDLTLLLRFWERTGYEQPAPTHTASMISSNVHLFLPHLCPGAPICLRRIASGYCRKSFFVPRVCVSLLPETNRYAKSAAMNDSYLSDRCTSSRSIATEHSGLLPLLIIQLPIQSNRTISMFRFCAPKLLPVPPFPSRLFAKTSRNQSEQRQIFRTSFVVALSRGNSTRPRNTVNFVPYLQASRQTDVFRQPTSRKCPREAAPDFSAKPSQSQPPHE